MSKKKKTILAACIAAVLVVGGGIAAWLIFGGGSGAGESVYVENVGDIAGLGSGSGLFSRYGGVVEAQEIVRLNLDQEKTLGEIFVEVGDEVKAGDALFSYDVESLKLTYEQLKIDLAGIENNIKTQKEQIADLKNQLSGAGGDERLELTLQIQTMELQVEQAAYDRDKKQLEVDKAEAAISDNVVKSGIDGVVRSIDTTGGGQPGGEDVYMDPSMQETAFMTLMSSQDYRVKGTVSEQTVSLLAPGMPVIVRSRTDETQIWRGTLESINTEQPETNTGGGVYYGGMDSGQTASKYPFYITLEDSGGLMMGQHVYIEPDMGQSQAKDGIWIPSYYIVREDEEAFVYADNGRGRLEKRSIALGGYDEGMDTHEVTDGLTAEDFIAFPAEGIQAGAATVKPSEQQPQAPEQPDLPGGEMDGGMAEGGEAYDEMDGGTVDDGIVYGGLDGGTATVPADGAGLPHAATEG